MVAAMLSRRAAGFKCVFDNTIAYGRNRTGLRMINSASPMLIIHPAVSNIALLSPASGSPVISGQGTPVRAGVPAPCAIA